jgi:hypothetical protein
VTEPIVPRVELIATVAPPLVRLLPAESLSCTVIVALEPPTLIEAAELVTVDVDVDALPAAPVAVKVTGEPEREPDVAVRVLLPATVPKVHAGEVAIPDAFVVTEPEDASDPPPLATAKVTLAPEIGLPEISATSTDGAVVTAVPTVADWLLPALSAIDAAAPAPVGVIVEVAEVSPLEVKVNVVAEEVDPVNDSPANVATPDTAAIVRVPESVPAPAATVTFAVDDVTVFPLASVIRTTGCVASVASESPATGAVTTRIFVATPTTNVTVSVSVIANELSVPLIVAVPTVVAEVSVAVYVPEPAYETAPKDPAVVDSATVAALLVTAFPSASFNVTVMVEVEVPLAVMDAADAVIVEVAVEGPLTVKVTEPVVALL